MTRYYDVNDMFGQEYSTSTSPTYSEYPTNDDNVTYNHNDRSLHQRNRLYVDHNMNLPEYFTQNNIDINTKREEPDNGDYYSGQRYNMIMNDAYNTIKEASNIVSFEDTNNNYSEDTGFRSSQFGYNYHQQIARNIIDEYINDDEDKPSNPRRVTPRANTGGSNRYNSITGNPSPKIKHNNRHQ